MKPLELEGRYSEDIEKELGGFGRIIASHVNNDYQGECKYLIDLGSRYAIVEWTWGSCSGCDERENMNPEESAQWVKDCISYIEKGHLPAYIDNIAQTDPDNWILKGIAKEDTVLEGTSNPMSKEYWERG